jgi:hypothetical protein
MQSTHQITLEDWAYSPNYWARVDEWFPIRRDEIFKETKNAIILPVSQFFGVSDSKVLNSFILTPKRCYNSDEVRTHICRYLNYFERFYDPEHELLFYMYRMKQLMDIGYIDQSGNTIKQYDIFDFKRDIKTYILSNSMYDKAWKMVEHNYQLDLNYKNKTNEGLQYSNRHGKYFMEMSLFMNMLIPLIMHFVYRNKIMSTEKVNDIIFEIYNWLFEQYVDVNAMARRGLQPADMYAKLYETASTTMKSHYKSNKILWTISEIRGYSPTINANDSINTVIMQVMPKYTYDGNVITYNITSVRNNIKYNISDISYEFDYVSLSSSKRDGEDNTSQFDKFEAHLIKTDEGLLLHNDFRAEKVMNMIISRYGPFKQEEIDFYKQELMKQGRPIINRFQQNLINNMFYKYFGDTVSINSINADQYVILMIAAKRIMLADNMRLLPYIISSSIQQISQRTTLCKKELIKLEQSEYYNMILAKYNGDEKKIKQILALIATILSSKFNVIDYWDKSIHGIEILMEPDILIDEILRYIVQI